MHFDETDLKVTGLSSFGGSLINERLLPEREAVFLATSVLASPDV